MITYGSYVGRRESIVKSSVVIVALDTIIALFATIIMFSVIFSVDGVREEVSGSTVGMLFITLPRLFYTAVPLGWLLAPLLIQVREQAQLAAIIAAVIRGTDFS